MQKPANPSRPPIHLEDVSIKIRQARSTAIPMVGGIAYYFACRGLARLSSQVNAPVTVADREVRSCSGRSDEHTSELQSLMRISYAVFCLKTKRHMSATIYI